MKKRAPALLELRPRVVMTSASDAAGLEQQIADTAIEAKWRWNVQQNIDRRERVRRYVYGQAAMGTQRERTI